MSAEDQARAYAEADFEEPHSRCVQLFAATFPDRPAVGVALEPGCGTGDITIRFARANPGYTVHAVDGSAAMLRHAQAATAGQPELATRIQWIEGILPRVRLPQSRYDVILSNSLLHHLHEPRILWEIVCRYSRAGTLVYVMDLFRAASREQAAALTEQYCGTEPVVLKQDFFNSLLAAFTLEEVRDQLTGAGLGYLTVSRISDRHLLVAGTIR